jgi:hypothetical protein
MPGRGKPTPVAEHEADGDVERIYHEIKQTLRVTGINLNFRTWAGDEKFFVAMWEAVRPNAETRAFENAADRIRAEAVRAAATLGSVEAAARVHLGESQLYQLRAALHLYHYINPKLLLLTSAVRLALEGERFEADHETHVNLERLERGEPEKMYPMEMVADEPDDPALRDLFDDIKRTLSLASINSDYRTLALWPEYLAAAWAGLKPIIARHAYRTAADELRQLARSLARTLPHPIPLSRQRVQDLGEDAEAILETTATFEQLLPPLILNIALCELDWLPADVLCRSPFPAAPRPVPGNEKEG